jgi:hypothetical protein
MDLRHFHDINSPNTDYGAIDRMISRTGSFHCDFLEWTGWYDISVRIRLLGHYRLFQLYKKDLSRNSTGLSSEYTYVLYYRENRHLKYSWAHQTIAFLKPLLIKSDRNADVKSINRILLFKRPEILQNFLATAETDFDKALLTAIDLIHDPAFLSASPLTQVHLQVQETHQHNTTLAKNELHIHPVIKEEATPPPSPKGKEEGVFSKKQVLLFFDLLARDKKLEPIDFRKPKKFKDIAPLLRALTHRGEETWIAELNDYRHKELYAYSSDGERQELIRILINLAEKFRQAGLESVAKLADKKIIELEHAAH